MQPNEMCMQGGNVVYIKIDNFNDHNLLRQINVPAELQRYQPERMNNGAPNRNAFVDLHFTIIQILMWK